MATIIASPAPNRTLPRRPIWERQGPTGTAVALYAAIAAALLLASYRAAGHHFVYALDDPYITMAMSKSLALHGIWGITRYAFSSSSSSPLFTLLLAAAFRLTGVHEGTALVLSLSFGAIGIWQVDRLLSVYAREATRLFVLLAAVVLAPLFAIGIIGMEHTLHFALTIAFLRSIQERRLKFPALALVTALMVGARYEGLFAAAAAVMLLARWRAWRSAAAVIIGSAAPVVLYGLFAVAHGSYFLPNSVALKGNSFQSGSVLVPIIVRCIHARHLMVIAGALIAASVGLRRREPALSSLAGVVAFMTTAHIMFASCGAAFRYETYIAGAGVTVIGAALSYRERFSRNSWFTFAGFAVATCCLLSVRAYQACTRLPGYSGAIYSQQLQSARFLRTYFPNASVAANDIGAISYFTNIHCTDLVGLADSPIFYAKHGGHYTTAFIRQETEANHVQIALVYDIWFTGDQWGFWLGPRLPSEWKRVARLSVPHSEVLGGDVVSIYAVQPSEAEPLRRDLQQFRSTLPSSDRLTIEY
jgi:hypothetical protein